MEGCFLRHIRPIRTGNHPPPWWHQQRGPSILHLSFKKTSPQGAAVSARQPDCTSSVLLGENAVFEFRKSLLLSCWRGEFGGRCQANGYGRLYGGGSGKGRRGIPRAKFLQRGSGRNVLTNGRSPANCSGPGLYLPAY